MGHRTSGRPVRYLEERLNSNRWEVRYFLALDLNAGDQETRKTLEALLQDPNESVVNQATAVYLNYFVIVRKDLIRPGAFIVAAKEASTPEQKRAWVEYALGLKAPPHSSLDMAEFQDLRHVAPDDPAASEAITIVGLLGSRADATLLRPFASSSNEYVALSAAKSLIRMEDRANGVRALEDLARRRSKNDLHYVAEALAALKELEAPSYPTLLRRALAELNASDSEVSINGLNNLLFLAAETDASVWSRPLPAAGSVPK
jgi:HEAT repeat protein